MKKFGLVLLLLSMGAVAEQRAFVGSPLEVKLLDQGCNDFLVQNNLIAEKAKLVCLDRVFALTYEVIDFLDNPGFPEKVELIAFYHGSGMPHYVSSAPVLVVVRPLGERLEVVAVEPVRRIGGNWSLCTEDPEQPSEGDCNAWMAVDNYIRDDYTAPSRE